MERTRRVGGGEEGGGRRGEDAKGWREGCGEVGSLRKEGGVRGAGCGAKWPWFQRERRAQQGERKGKGEREAGTDRAARPASRQPHAGSYVKNEARHDAAVLGAGRREKRQSWGCGQRT